MTSFLVSLLFLHLVNKFTKRVCLYLIFLIPISKLWTDPFHVQKGLEKDEAVIEDLTEIVWSPYRKFHQAWNIGRIPREKKVNISTLTKKLLLGNVLEGKSHLQMRLQMILSWDEVHEQRGKE